MMDSALAFLQSLQGIPAYALLFALLFGCGVGLPMNEDIVLMGAAALTLQGVMEPLPLVRLPARRNMPSDTIASPAKLLAALRASTPLPVLVNPPAPESAPARVTSKGAPASLAA